MPCIEPVLASGHETPFICQTQTSVTWASTEPLGQPLAEPCSIAIRIDYFYRYDDGALVPMDPDAGVPVNAATKTTTERHAIPCVARLETGTINRAIYQTAVLDDPAVAGPDIIAADPA